MRKLVVDGECLRSGVRLGQLLVVAELRALPSSLPRVDGCIVPARCVVQSRRLSGRLGRGLSFLRGVGAGVPLRAVARPRARDRSPAPVGLTDVLQILLDLRQVVGLSRSVQVLVSRCVIRQDGVALVRELLAVASTQQLLAGLIRIGAGVVVESSPLRGWVELLLRLVEDQAVR